MRTQQQRSSARKKRDKADFQACMEREGQTCQRCGQYATQMHHGKRKHMHVRHNPQWHYALCYPCHDWSHKNVAAWMEFMEANPNPPTPCKACQMEKDIEINGLCADCVTILEDIELEKLNAGDELCQS